MGSVHVDHVDHVDHVADADPSPRGDRTGELEQTISPATPELIGDIVARVGTQPFARWFGRSMRGGITIGTATADPHADPHADPVAGRTNPALVIAATSAFQLECVRERFQRELAAVAVDRLGATAVVDYRVAPLLKLPVGPLHPSAPGDTPPAVPTGPEPGATTALAHVPAPPVARQAAPIGASAAHLTAAKSAVRPAVRPARPPHQQRQLRMDAERASVEHAVVAGSVGDVAPATDLIADDDRAGSARSGPRLEEFVIGASNQMAFDAALRIADPALADGGGSPRSLFLHGECGVGKTHLLRGICRRRRELAPGQQVLYTTGEAFTNEFIAALRGHRLDEFRRWIRGLDLLAIDDVHFLADKQRTTSEFLHTIDAIGLDGNRVVLASDAPLDRIRAFSQALVSRLNAGMVIRIDLPDRTLRLALLRRLAARRGIVLDPAAEQELATRITGTAREIEGSLHRLELLRDIHPRDAQAREGRRTTAAVDRSATGLGAHLDGSHQGADATDATDANAATEDAAAVTAAVDVVLSDHATDRGERVRPAAIVSAVCSVLGLDRSELLGHSRHRTIVLGRMLVAWVCRDLTGMSFPEIAGLLGRKNHSTVHCAYKRIAALMARHAIVEGVLDRPNTGGAASIDEVVELVSRTARRAG